MGYIKASDGIGQIIPNILTSLKNDLKIKFIPTKQTSLDNLSKEVLGFAKNPGSLGNDKFILHTWLSHLNAVKKTPNKINVAYIMCETTQFPKQTAQIINKNFDAIAVPDIFLLNIFKNSGVRIPIFVLPLIVNLQKFLEVPIKKHPNKIFTFGCTAAFWERKNHLLLIKAFNQEFGNNPNVKLKLHGRFGEMYNTLKEFIQNKNIINVEINEQLLSQEHYIETLKSFDCFVLVSKGEGFSIPPREALALGIPCIISNNTSHTTICNSGFAKAVKANKITSAKNGLQSSQIGFNFDCNLNDVKIALREVYNNYSAYLKKSCNGKQWTMQYLPENLRLKYLNLIKPKKVILGSKNIITNEYLMTNSKNLFIKYLNIFKI